MTHVCDGCGATVDAAHLQERIRRLERATRFRPLHIHTLLLLETPPPEPASDFYAVAGQAEEQGQECQSFTEASAGGDLTSVVARAIHVSREGKPRDEVLAAIQRAGMFVAYARECPQSDAGASSPPSAGEVQKLLLRARFSYKPKHVVALGARLRATVEALKQAGFAAENCAGPDEGSFAQSLGEALRRTGIA